MGSRKILCADEEASIVRSKSHVALKETIYIYGKLGIGCRKFRRSL
jgi:hypothetical protein